MFCSYFFLLEFFCVSWSGPIPGGCNMEFSLENSPFLLLSSTDSLAHILYQGASWTPLTCDTLSTNFALQYELFYLDLTQRDHSSQAYFDSLKSFSSVADIRKEFTKVSLMRCQNLFRSNSYASPGIQEELPLLVPVSLLSLTGGCSQTWPQGAHKCLPWHWNVVCDCGLTKDQPFSWISICACSYLFLSSTSG